MQPDEPVVFFVDASLGRRIVADALRGQGVEVVAHDDLFPPGTHDEAWLGEAGRRGWVVITKDKRIRYRIAELRALRRAKVGAFVLVGKNMTGPEMATALVTALPRMRGVLRTTERPFIASVGPTGRVKVLIC